MYRGRLPSRRTYSDTLTRNVKALIKEARDIFHNTRKDRLSLELENESRTRNRKYLINRVNEIFDDNLTTYYIPAGRSLLTLLSASRASMNSLQNLDFIMNRFMELIDGVRDVFHNGVTKVYKYFPDGSRPFDVKDIANDIIKMQKGEYINTFSGEKLLVHTENNEISEVEINFSSSGQQEILWLLNFLYVLMLRREKAFVIIEEPEAHIYPSLQKNIIEFIVQFANLCNSNIFITTHSPYVLTSVNNLYYAGTIIREDQNKAKSVNKVIKKNYIIMADDLTALKLDSSETNSICDLLQDDEYEINSYMIDEISDGINELYTQLYKIKEDY